MRRFARSAPLARGWQQRSAVSTPPARPLPEAEFVAGALPPARRRFLGPAPEHRRRLAALSLAALGVVFGDIGTSPLYAFRECFHPDHGITATPAAVYGVLSLIVWALILVVSVKYVAFIMRLDNRGEGGILALPALVQRTRRAGGQPPRSLVVLLGLFGAALLYGDGVITPAISVLGATEGLEIASHALHSLRALHASALGLGRHRIHLRTDHARVVRDHRGARRGGDRPGAGDSDGHQSVARRALPGWPRHGRLPGPGRRRARRDRRRGALR